MAKSSCTTVKDFLDNIGVILNDEGDQKACAQNKRWPDKSRMNAYKEAICSLREYRPDAFSESIEVPLVSGQMQELPEDYVRILSVVGNADGTKISALDERSNVFNDQVSGLQIGCRGSDGGEFKAISAEVDPNNNRAFCVTPAVTSLQSKNGASVTVMAMKSDDCICLEDCIPNEFKSALTDWVLFRMYSFETDSQYLLQKANNHRGYFENSVDKQYRYNSAQGSGYWLGDIGGGDGGFRSRSP